MSSSGLNTYREMTIPSDTHIHITHHTHTPYTYTPQKYNSLEYWFYKNKTLLFKNASEIKKHFQLRHPLTVKVQLAWAHPSLQVLLSRHLLFLSHAIQRPRDSSRISVFIGNKKGQVGDCQRQPMEAKPSKTESP